MGGFWPLLEKDGERQERDEDMQQMSQAGIKQGRCGKDSVLVYAASVLSGYSLAPLFSAVYWNTLKQLMVASYLSSWMFRGLILASTTCWKNGQGMKKCVEVEQGTSILP